jgi:hypothetical protein
MGLPLLLRYGVERDISRLTGSALFLGILLGFPLAWTALRRAARFTQAWLGAAYFVAILGGLALFNLELIAITRPQLTYFVQDTDARLSQSTWDRLPGGVQVLDLSTPYRAVTLFGRPGGRAYLDLYNPLPDWQALLAAPEPARLAEAGYAYVYLDKTAWQNLNPEAKASFQQPCVRQVAEETTDLNDFRRLVDIQDCNPATKIIP